MTHFLSRVVLGLVIASACVADEPFPAIFNTQKPGENPPPPEESLKMVTVPEGFKVTLAAAEPAVEQPIAMTVDDRGRLWVVENFTYDGHSWDEKLRDRVVIFEDVNHTGKFDKRTVVWEGGRNLTGITLGFGGMYLLSAPNLIFVPVKDDKAAGEPVVLLDGFIIAGVGHNIVNGLTWGPDGWIYGRHGIQSTSMVGKPGSSASQRVKLNCSIWRYHPTRQVFEVVCNGTTNPWGFDYDDFGEMWFTNNVIGHLWHIVPGAHYRRMYGEDFNPRTYELIDQTADHYHWDTGGKWSEAREGNPTADKLGGGHSHCGGMIYLGDNFPAEYRNTMFACNTHGKRVNNDALVWNGHGFTATHRPDFFNAHNTWFRGLDLKTTNDGGVYITDWSDSGECHDHDGIHRTSGRIYKVVYGTPRPPEVMDVANLRDDELVTLQLHKNDFYVRAARRVLQERAANGSNMTAVHNALRKMFDENPDITRKLRAMWALYVTGGADEAWLTAQVMHADEHVRAWAVRLLVDRGEVPGALAARLAQVAANDPSPLVQLYLASAATRMEPRLAALLVGQLAKQSSSGNNVQTLMTWYAAEPAVSADPNVGLKMLATTRDMHLAKLIVRRLAEGIESSPAAINTVLDKYSLADVKTREAILDGVMEATRGWRKAQAPEAWKSFAARIEQDGSPAMKDKLRELSVLFGDGRALDSLIAVAKDDSADPEARKAALRVIVDTKDPKHVQLIKKLANDKVVQGVAIRGLANFNEADTSKLILSNFARYTPDVQVEAINTLSARPQWASALLKQVESGQVPRTVISAFQARQIRSLGDEKLSEQLSKVWGEVRGTAEEKKQLIARFRDVVSPDKMKTADAGRGRVVFNSICAACHTLYGQGGKIGPDLTGANRDNVDYLLENIIDPSAVVAADFRMTMLTLKDGRVIGGLIPAQTERTVTVQTPTEKITLERSDIAKMETSPISMMPEGLLLTMTEPQVRDLFAYLMGKQQVELAK